MAIRSLFSLTLCFVSLLPYSALADVVVADMHSPALDELNDDQKQVFGKVANQALCPCNCPLTLGGCLAQKPKCGKAQILSRFIGRLAKEGLTAIDILTQLQEGFSGSAAEPKQSFSKQPAAMCKGKSGGKIQIVEFADFRCPHCREAVKYMNEVVHSLPEASVCFKNFPLQALEPSVLAAEAAEAAAAQGKFWPYHDLLFKNQDQVGRDDLIRYAKDSKLDVGRFTKELDEHKYKATVLQERDEGNRAGIQGTPAIYVNGRELKLERTVEALKDRADYDNESECTQ